MKNTVKEKLDLDIPRLVDFNNALNDIATTLIFLIKDNNTYGTHDGVLEFFTTKIAKDLNLSSTHLVNSLRSGEIINAEAISVVMQLFSNSTVNIPTKIIDKAWPEIEKSAISYISKRMLSIKNSFSNKSKINLLQEISEQFICKIYNSARTSLLPFSPNINLHYLFLRNFMQCIELQESGFIDEVKNAEIVKLFRDFFLILTIINFNGCWSN